jgi:Family of unknown function (DUF5754)
MKNDKKLHFFCIIYYILMASSIEILKKYSDPSKVLTLAKKYYKQHPPLTCKNKRVSTNKHTGILIGKLNSKLDTPALYVSTRKNKKYTLFNGCKTVHFGQLPYEDFTKHKNRTRRKNYLTRSNNIKGNWKSDPYSPNNLSIHLLW